VNHSISQTATHFFNSLLDAIRDETEKQGKPWPSAKVFERTAGKRLRDKGLQVTNDEIAPFAKQDKYKAKRRSPGVH
jgi:hypothetical protein